MRAMQRNVLSLLGIGAGFAALFAGVTALAHDHDGESGDRRDRVRILVVDDDGTRHDESFEFEGSHRRGFLGVQLDQEPGGGARIERIVEGSAAERAGLREGDVVIGFDGDEVESPWDLHRLVLRSEAGADVQLEVLRDGSRETLSAELGEREGSHHGFGHFDHEALERSLGKLENLEGLELRMEQLHERLGEMDFDFDFDLDGMDFGHSNVFVHHARPRLGVELTGVTPELREHLGAPRDAGVLVGRVMPGMPAEEAGVRVGDLIVAVDGEPIEDSHDLRSALRSAEGRTVDLDLVRDGAPTSVAVYIPEPEQHDEGVRRERPPAARPIAGPRQRT